VVRKEVDKLRCYPASLGLPNPALQGGRMALEWVTGFAWIGCVAAFI